MAGPAPTVYVVSDLHIGGTYGNPADPTDRGFRIMTQVDRLAAFVQALARKPANDRVELVVNGDFVDFLAERDESPPHWRPFVPDADAAVAKLEAVVSRDASLFAAFGELLGAGHRLTLLLGNHDVELSFPAVRARLRELCGGGPDADYQFTYDGEAYVVGDALIEHGNRYDGFNAIDLDGLRRVRSLQSRRTAIPRRWEFEAPPGSFLVANVINPIKERYRFIDLLKPETGAVIPLLLALEPGTRSLLGRAAKQAWRAARFRLDTPALPAFGGDIRSEGGTDGFDALGGDIAASNDEPDEAAALEAALRETLGDAAGPFLADLEASGAGADDMSSLRGDISAGERLEAGLGLFRLLTGSGAGDLEKRLPALLQAFRAAQHDRSFDDDCETNGATLAAARELARGGFRTVIFGHTHMAKRVALEDGATYLNSGTWADLVRFPSEILAGSRSEAMVRVREFVEDMRSGDLRRWVGFRPTYVRLERAGERVVRAELLEYTGDREV